MQPQRQARIVACAVLHCHLLLVHYCVVDDCATQHRGLGHAKERPSDDKAIAMERQDLLWRQRHEFCPHCALVSQGSTGNWPWFPGFGPESFEEWKGAGREQKFEGKHELLLYLHVRIPLRWSMEL
jgi:hypothetical protein